MLDTPSLFESMEIDNTQRRVSSRRALALAHNRVERNLGCFLRAAQTEEEFFERLGLVQEDWDGYITTASTEVGHDHPEHIATSLKDHYRLAVEFKKTPAEEQEKEDEEEAPVISSTKLTWDVTAIVPMAPAGGGPSVPPVPPQDLNMLQGLEQPAQVPQPPQPQNPAAAEMLQGIGQGVPNQPQPQNPAGQQPAQAQHPNFQQMQKALPPEMQSFIGSTEDEQRSPLVKEATPYDWSQRPQGVPGPSRGPDADLDESHPGYDDEEVNECPTCGGPAYLMGQLGHTNHYRCRNCGQNSSRPSNAPEDQFGRGNSWAGYAPDDHGPMDSDPYDDERNFPRQGSNEHQLVTCPACGGVPKTVGGKCSKCHNKGKVPNFGDSMVDAVGADIKTAGDGNTDLGGPEPKMDKGQWTPGNPAKPKSDGVEKDVTEVIGPMNNEDDPQEIDQDLTHQTLPTQKGDKPFADNNMEMAPHTKTFGDSGQTDPVTREALGAMEKAAMGMSAQDFRMLADAIRTAPENTDKATLADHVAQYLRTTNPLFDADRFLAAALGEHQTGRDQYRGPVAPQAASPAGPLPDNAPGNTTFPEQWTAKADDIYKGNPLVELVSSEFPSDSVVHEALLRLQ